MTSFNRKGVLAISSLAALLALGGCNRPGEPTAGQKLDEAIAKTKQAADKAKEEAQDAAARAKAAADKAADKSADSTKSMGSAGADKVDDAAITTKVNAALAHDKDLSATRINVDTRDGVVTLSGPAPSPAAKARAAELAGNVKGVSSVKNNLTVKAG
jgi:hyperosmotically inducible periplasmic protein